MFCVSLIVFDELNPYASRCLGEDIFNVALSVLDQPQDRRSILTVVFHIKEKVKRKLPWFPNTMTTFSRSGGQNK